MATKKKVEAPVVTESAVVEEPVVEEAKVEEPVVEEAKAEEQLIEESAVVEEPLPEKEVKEKFEFDSSDTFVTVNIDEIAKLRVRNKPSIHDSEVVAMVGNKSKHRVISDENPDWVFIEVGDTGLRGYVKKMFLLETADSTAR